MKKLDRSEGYFFCDYGAKPKSVMKNNHRLIIANPIIFRGFKCSHGNKMYGTIN